MSSFQRAQLSTLLSRLREPPKWLIVVAGPRQTGKTTLVRQALEQIDLPNLPLSVDQPEPSALSLRAALPPDDQEDAIPISDVKDTAWLIRKWEQARVEAKRSERGFVLVFDEIQKIPNWSETVKGLWDADRHEGLPLHVVVLGSAPLLMQRGLSESMLGRFETIRLPHWSFAEMSEAFGFDLDRYIYFGGYPGAASLIQEQRRWREYILGSIIEPNIERDILAMERVDKPALLKRLFEFGAEISGQILAYDKMLGQIQDAGNTTTLARYLDLLSKAGLLTGLGKYAGGATAAGPPVPNSTCSTPRSCRFIPVTRSKRRKRIEVSGDDWSKAPLVHTCSIRERRRCGFITGGNDPLRWISSWSTAGNSWRWKSKADRIEGIRPAWRNSQRASHPGVHYLSVRVAFRSRNFYRPPPWIGLSNHDLILFHARARKSGKTAKGRTPTEVNAPVCSKSFGIPTLTCCLAHPVQARPRCSNKRLIAQRRAVSLLGTSSRSMIDRNGTTRRCLLTASTKSGRGRWTDAHRWTEYAGSSTDWVARGSGFPAVRPTGSAPMTEIS